MNKINNKLIFLIISFSFLIGCQSLKDGLEGNKRSKSAEEFLIEKKNPLVLPPDYGKLPEPSDNKMDQKKEEEENEIKVSLSKNKLESNEIIKNSEPTSIEESILKKIK